MKPRATTRGAPDRRRESGHRFEEGFYRRGLPFLDTYRTLLVMPPPDVLRVLLAVKEQLAAA